MALEHPVDGTHSRVEEIRRRSYLHRMADAPSSSASSSSADARARQARLRSQLLDEKRRSAGTRNTSPPSTNPFDPPASASSRNGSRGGRQRATWGEDDDEEAEAAMRLTPNEAAQLRIQRSHEEADASLDRSLGKLDETLHTGANTAVQLHEQREQIHRIRNDLKDTHETMDRSQYILNGMKSWGGAFMNMFRKPPAPRGDLTQPEPEFRGQSSNHTGGQQQQQVPVSSRALPVSAEDASAQSREDAKLDLIHARLKTLGTMATDMNAELRLHNDLLTDMEDNVDHLDTRIKDQTRQMRRL